jgi:hypothetical protein
MISRTAPRSQTTAGVPATGRRPTALLPWCRVGLRPAKQESMLGESRLSYVLRFWSVVGLRWYTPSGTLKQRDGCKRPMPSRSDIQLNTRPPDLGSMSTWPAEAPRSLPMEDWFRKPVTARGELRVCSPREGGAVLDLFRRRAATRCMFPVQSDAEKMPPSNVRDLERA